MTRNPESASRTKPKATLHQYVAGFILSILLTLTAFVAVVEHRLSPRSLILLISGMALIQAAVQLLFFLHLDREQKPRWNLMMFLFMGLVVLIVVIGSLWIMNNLNYNMMSPHDTEQHLIEQEGLDRY